MHNIAYRYDHDFWSEHYPPNGWGCQCYVVAMDDDDMEENDITKGTNEGAFIDVPDEWKHNPGQEVLAPRFGDMEFLKRQPKMMQDILQNYTADMEGARLLGNEFVALAKQLREYQSADKITVPDTYVVVGVLRKELYDALSSDISDLDVKVIASTKAIAHALRVEKVGKDGYRDMPEDKYKHVLEVIDIPDVIYKDKKNFVFAKQLDDDDSMRVVFGHKVDHPLDMRTIDYFEDGTAIDRVVKKGVIYEK